METLIIVIFWVYVIFIPVYLIGSLILSMAILNSERELAKHVQNMENKLYEVNEILIKLCDEIEHNNNQNSSKKGTESAKGVIDK